MRKFYLAFPILDALRQELSWTHYRLLCRLDTEAKRNYYLTESIENNWNSRTLQRQINSLAFERVIQHKKKQSEPAKIDSIIKDPYIFEFLGLLPNLDYTENAIETAIISHLQHRKKAGCKLCDCTSPKLGVVFRRRSGRQSSGDWQKTIANHFAIPSTSHSCFLLPHCGP